MGLGNSGLHVHTDIGSWMDISGLVSLNSSLRRLHTEVSRRIENLHIDTILFYYVKEC
jgi:hypothetical protein